MEVREFHIEVEAKVNDKAQRVDVIIHTSTETVKQKEWKEVEAGIIEKIEKKLEKQGRGNYKIVARVETQETDEQKQNSFSNKQKEAEELFSSISSMLSDPQVLIQFLKGFTPEGLKKAEEIILSSKKIKSAELIEKAQKELNGADFANFVARVPLITEINKAIGVGASMPECADAPASLIALLLAQLVPEEQVKDIKLRDGEDIIKIILTADTRAVMETASMLIDALKAVKNEED